MCGIATVSALVIRQQCELFSDSLLLIVGTVCVFDVSDG